MTEQTPNSTPSNSPSLNKKTGGEQKANEVKQFFDWLRSHQADKRLTQTMVDGANDLLAIMGVDELKTTLSKINDWTDVRTMSLSDKGMAILKEFEGFRSKPYRDIVGKATIGYGSTYYLDAHGKRTAVTMKDKAMTRQQAHDLKLKVVNADFAPAVNVMFADEINKGEISQNMFDALICLAYNIGTRGLAGSSVYRHIKAGRYDKAGDAFLLWNKGRVHGRLQVLQGLNNRRKAERELFLA